MSNKTKGITFPIQVSSQTVDVRIEQIEDDVVRFENNEAGISVHVDYDIWAKIGQPGALIVATLVPHLGQKAEGE